jgi:hypothetical protein
MKYTHILPLKFKAGLVDSVIYSVVLEDENGLVLIDCGFPGFLPNIEEAVSQLGFSTRQLRKVILTHHDQDHMGSLKEITDRYPEVEVYCSEEQAPYVTEKRNSCVSNWRKNGRRRLPPGRKNWQTGNLWSRFPVSGLLTVSLQCMTERFCRSAAASGSLIQAATCQAHLCLYSGRQGACCGGCPDRRKRAAQCTKFALYLGHGQSHPVASQAA